MKRKHAWSRGTSLWHSKGTSGYWFVTFNSALRRRLTNTEREFVMAIIKEGDAQFYELLSVVIMPDHIHLLIRLIGQSTVSRIVSAVKGRTSKHFVKNLGRSAPIWQADWHEVELVTDLMMLSRIGYIQKNIAEITMAGEDAGVFSYTSGNWCI